MVCEKCEAKLSKVSAPNPWRTSTAAAGGRKINENKALSSAKERYNPMGSSLAPCRYVWIVITIINITYCIFLQHLQTEGASNGCALLPGVLLQKSHLCHVRQKDSQYKELQTKCHITTQGKQ